MMMDIQNYAKSFKSTTVDSRYSGSLKYGHLDIPAIWLDTEC